MIEYFKDNSLVWFWCQSSEGDGGDVARVGTAVKGLNGTAAHDDKRADSESNCCDACHYRLCPDAVGIHGFALDLWLG